MWLVLWQNVCNRFRTSPDVNAHIRDVCKLWFSAVSIAFAEVAKTRQGESCYEKLQVHFGTQDTDSSDLRLQPICHLCALR